ncbi:MAG: DUF664 domain-containing protein [Candidatus Eisenbacteria bacterium]|nr:DUF664 domain-containing protein [Candidatus Eisenbacteria bacterium]
MSSQKVYDVPPPPDFRSHTVALFLAQMDDQSRRLAEDTRGMSADELAWQSLPGMNSIGMLLAHIAVVEVSWTRLVLEDRPMPVDVSDVLGVGREATGMPLAPDAGPPASLAGKDLAFFDDLLAKARAHLARIASALADRDLERAVVRPRPGGGEGTVTVRWTLYHLLEHLAGHYGQVLLLRHQYRATHAG